MREFTSAIVLGFMISAWALFIYTLPLNGFPGFERSALKLSSAADSGRMVNFATVEHGTPP